MPFVSRLLGVNYDLSKYLPDFATDKAGAGCDGSGVWLSRHGACYGKKDVSLQEAKRIREEISAVDGVGSGSRF